MCEHANRPQLAGHREWRACGCTGTGQVREQVITAKGQQAPWRRMELALDAHTENGETTIWLWSNLLREVGGGRVAELYRTRWRIESMFGRLESVLYSEVTSLGHPRAALAKIPAAQRLEYQRRVCGRHASLRCPSTVHAGGTFGNFAYNVLALLARYVEQAHQQQEPPPEVSTYHLAVQIRDTYEDLMIAVPPECWPPWQRADLGHLAERLLHLACHINPY